MVARSDVEGLARPWVARYSKKVNPVLEIPPGLLTDLVERSAQRWADRPAVVFYGTSWSYRELWRRSRQLAAALAAEGVVAGDRVALMLPNVPLYPVGLLAAWWLGAAVVQVSPLLVADDLKAVLDDSRPKALVTLDILHARIARLPGEARPPVEFVGRLRSFYPALRRPFVNFVVRRRGFTTRVPSEPRVHALPGSGDPVGDVPKWTGDPGATVALLQYTGGTTGRPKAAMLSHANLVANVTQVNAWNTTRVPGEEVILASVPFFHIYGLTVALLKGLADGSTVVLQIQPEARELLRLVDRYRPTQLPAVPAIYRAFLGQPHLERYRIRSIKFCVSGSAPLPPDLREAFRRATGADLIEGYGLTEASPVTHVNPEEGERRPGSIGLPLPGTDHRIVEAESGARDLGVGEIGELCVRGPQVMLGYFHAPEETDGVLRGGWLFTGDLARVDADGYAYVVDRKKDMINVGGLKVYPREVEETLLTHPSVADAAVVGVPDLASGEVPRAFVVLKPGANLTEQETIAFVREHLAHYKAPRTVVFRDALPRSAIQKVLRRELRAGASSTEASGSAPAR